MMNRTTVAATLFSLCALFAAVACPAPPPPPCEGVQCAVGPAFPTGSLPNDVALALCDAAAPAVPVPVALVASSGDARLVVHELPGGAVRAAPFFEPGSSPWSVDAVFALPGPRAVVSLFGSDSVALVDPCGARTIAVLDDIRDAADVRQITPQAVVIIDERAFVSFTNVITFSIGGEPPQLGPGAVAVLDIGDDQLVLDELRVLDDCVNPQGLAAIPGDGPGDGPGDVVVSCSGPLAEGEDGGQEAVADGTLLVGTTPGAHRIDAARFAPGTPAVVNGCVVAGSLVDPIVLSAALLDDALGVALELPGRDVDAAFKVAAWDDDTVLIVQFSEDLLHVVDVAADCSLSLATSIAVGPGGVGFRGALSVDVDKGRSFDAAVLLGLSAEVVPLQLVERGVLE